MFEKNNFLRNFITKNISTMTLIIIGLKNKWGRDLLLAVVTLIIFLQ